jgi:hypothetical protein
MIRFGAVITFRSEVTKQQADDALRSIEKLLARDFLVYPTSPDGQEDYTKPPSVTAVRIERFEDRNGGPVWYVP